MIQFILNSETITTASNPGVTLLDFIRENKRLKGTKIGCREGDCGACTVLVGQLKDNRLVYESITSCIYPLGNVQGKHIVTVEGINLIDTLNVAQQALSDNFATQCGFCTPGFVVSMTGYAINKNESTETSCNDAISGNICRCTGYKSIERAGYELEKKLIDSQRTDNLDLLIEKDFIPEYFKGIPERLPTLKYIHQKSAGDVVANGTDIYVHHTDRLADEEVHLIALDPSLRYITFEGNTCSLGANTTVTDILENKRMLEMIPDLRAHLKLVSSEAIRNMGTLGGNFVNASPIGDMTIFFLALDATITLEHKIGSQRQLPLREFYQDYKIYDLKKEELLTAISFQWPASPTLFNFEKVSKRTHLDIASVNSAIQMVIAQNTIVEVHVSMGGVAPIPKYLGKTSHYLKGKNISPQTILGAERILQAEISPITDVRGTADYKRLLGRQLFFAHFIKLFPKVFSITELVAA